MMQNVARLRLNEPVRFDPARLEALCQNLGDDGAERAIAQGLEQIALKVAHIQALWLAQDQAEIAHVCKGLARVAGRIGMHTLAEVARDVECCAMGHDVAALGATIARLARIGDQSVNAIWTLDDISV